ncbi:MAG: exo-alpha-sialidase [Lentisphaeria bacterium]|nr:exo-alpha-sialidase [Lentisphaeria bacterium]
MTKANIIFSGLINSDNSYHGWPTLIKGNGENELIAVCSGGREAHICPFGRVYMYRSIDGGKNWSMTAKLSDGPLDDRDAGLCKTADGRLLMNYFTNILALSCNLDKRPESWRDKLKEITLETLSREHGFWMRYSDDNGVTWSEKYSIAANNPHGASLLSDGSLILVGRQQSNSFAYMYEGSRLGDKIVAIKSFDNGKTWEIISELPIAEGHSVSKCFEPYAIEAADGRIIAVIRDQNDFSNIRTYQTISSDGGRTWSCPKVVSEGGYPAHLLKLKNGKLLMSYGYRNAPYGIRCRISENSGDSWGEEIVLYDKGVSNDLGYPTTAELDDGKFITMYYEASSHSQSDIKYCIWELADA